MPRRSGTEESSESIRLRLVELLQNFREELLSRDLRKKILGLVPAHHLLRDLGTSLIPKEKASASRDRILLYLKKYQQTIVKGDELMVVAGISEWARRVRELRVEFGWRILSGEAAKEMAAAGDVSDDELDMSSMGADDYILLAGDHDRDAAYRWNTANEIRKTSAGVRDKILEYLQRNVGKTVTGDELRYVAGDVTEWARRVRELRTEQGWPIFTKSSGRPDLSVGVYLLERDRQSPPHDRRIPDTVRSEVLMRDKYKCQKCGWSHKLSNPSDPRFLEPHHIEHHAKGGENTPENLITLCTVCHDRRHAEEKKKL